MKASISKEVLQKCLSHLQGVVERRNTIPILANVKISTSDLDDHNLVFSATDMDLAIQEVIPANVTTCGELTVPAHTLHDIVRKLPSGSEITFEYSETDTNNRLKISAANCDFTLPVISATEFPEINITDVSHKFTLGKDDLCKLVNKSRFAISTEETRYYLNGIYLHQAVSDNVDMLRVVATDGHRLAQIQVPLPEGASDLPSVIIPRKTILEIKKVLEEQEEGTTVDIELTKSKVKFSFNNVSLVSKLIDGSYPNYERVIPKTNNLQLDINVKSFSEAIDRVATISSDKSRAIKFSLEENKLNISANNIDTGFAQENLDVDYKSKKIETGFNAKYLLEMISVLEGENVKLLFADGSSPTLIQDLSDDESLYVIMPMRM